MTRRRRLSTTLLWNMAAVTAVSILVVGSLWIVRERAVFREESRRARSDTVEERQELARKQVDRTLNFIEFKRSQTEARIRDGLREHVYEACVIASHLCDTYRGRLDQEELQRMVREALRPIRFNQGRGYFFATRLDGVEQLFADRPGLEGRNLLGMQDTRGAYVIRDMIHLVRDKGEGFYEYTWTMPGKTGRDFRKLSFVKLFEPFGWLIGTGEYLDDTEAEIQREIVERIHTLRFEPQGYVFIGTWEGKLLVPPGGDEDARALTGQGASAVRRELETKARAGGGFVTLPSSGGSGGDDLPRMLYVRGVKDWQWFVAANVSLDDLRESLAQGKLALDRRIRDHLVKMGAALGGVLLAALTLTAATARRTRKEFETFADFFRRAATRSTEINPDSLRFLEFRELAEAANRMLAERKHAGELYRMLAENVTDVIWTADLDLQLTSISPSVERMRGFTVEEALARGFEETLAPSILGRVREGLEEELALEQAGGADPERSRTFEVELRRNDDSTLWAETRVSFLRDSRGRAEGLLGVTRDITERRQAQAALRRRSAELAERVKELHCLYAISMAASRGTRALEEVLREVVELVPQGLQRPQSACARIEVGGLVAVSRGFRETPCGLSAPIVCRDEPVGRVEVYYREGELPAGRSPFLPEEAHLLEEIGTRLGLLAERKQSEAELLLAKDRAEAANLLKSAFLANVSHELHTPMNSILGYAQLLLDQVDGPLTPEQEGSLARLERNARHLLRLIDELLDLSRIEAGQVHMEHTAFSLRTAVAETVRPYASAAEEKGLRFGCAVDASAPDLLVGDGKRLQQVLRHLLENAVKFTTKGGVDLRVEPRGGAGGGLEVLFSVADTGVGIPAEQQADIFDAFIQADPSATRRHGGVGLGLAVSARLVQMMGGQIWVESRLGSGSTFHFTAVFHP